MRLEMMTDKIHYGQDNKNAPIVLQRPPPSEPMGGIEEGENFSKVLREGTLSYCT
jgi:hypothetical protein